MLYVLLCCYALCAVVLLCSMCCCADVLFCSMCCCAVMLYVLMCCCALCAVVLLCCYAAHTESPLFLKRRLIAAQSVCPLRHGKRNFQYCLAVKRETYCGVVFFCYPDCWIEVVTHAEGPGTGRPSRHRLDFLDFLYLQADTQMVPKIPSC